MRCRKCKITCKKPNRYRHWRENQLCAICDNGGAKKIRRLKQLA